MPVECIIFPHETQKSAGIRLNRQPELRIVTHVEERRFSAAKSVQELTGLQSLRQASYHILDRQRHSHPAAHAQA